MRKSKYVIVHGPSQGTIITLEGPTTTPPFYHAHDEKGNRTIIPLHWIKRMPGKRLKRARLAQGLEV